MINGSSSRSRNESGFIASEVTLLIEQYPDHRTGYGCICDVPYWRKNLTALPAGNGPPKRPIDREMEHVNHITHEPKGIPAFCWKKGCRLFPTRAGEKPTVKNRIQDIPHGTRPNQRNGPQKAPVCTGFRSMNQIPPNGNRSEHPENAKGQFSCITGQCPTRWSDPLAFSCSLTRRQDYQAG